ncbi:hypothetical protein K466DRAFT_415089 [Polyporus arcularius HHB13444]|uniref:Uncharacterized protein n=1 Tax=Polyporus arcularius HHB13444 TaxID=1314778 RepID=A0A5C3PLV7_9APHY|nr:hypothetical protein K466DRAFT_415089 [Polyporus arcularius HHB13444]
MHVKSEKGKIMEVSAPGDAAVQGKREEKSDKGKSRVKRGTDEKEIAAHSGNRKGKAKEDPMPKVTAKDVERQAATAQCGKLTDRKGKGVARPAPPRVADADKGHASQPAPTEAPRTGTKKNLSKKTGSTQSSAPIARASPPQPGPSSIQAAASDTDTETDNSDVTFYSSRNAGVVTAQTSLSSVEGGSSAMIPPKGLCFDYLEGHCYRQICRYSHNVDRTLFSNTSRPNAPAEGGAQLTNNDGFYRSSGRMTQDVAGRGNDPQVPPGLGLERMLPSGRDEETAEQSETVTITVHDSTKVTFSSGFGVAQVITGFESRQIILANLPPTVVPLDITTMLQSTFGEVVAVIPGESNTEGSVVYRVTFAQADAAAEAAAALHGSSLFGVRVTARVAAKKSTGIGGGTLEDGDVLFELPTPRLTAFIGYETKEQADRAIVLGDRKEIKGMLVSASRYQGIPMVGAYNVRFDGMPPDTTVKDLERFGKFESHMFARPKYSSMSGAIQGLRYKLLQLDERVTVNVLPPPYRKMFRLWAHFSDEQVAAVACENLHGFCPHFTGKQRIFAHHIKSLSYNLPPDFFDILAYDINLLRSYCVDDKGTSISVIDRRHYAGPTAPVFVKLVSRDMPALSKLKAAFDRLLRGEKVTENGHVVWDDFFASPAGIAFLADLERFHPKVRINRDPRRRTLALFGQEPQRGRAREDILARAKLLKARRQRRYPVAGDLIGVFMSEDVCKLQSELGHDNVWFDLTHKELVVRGDEDAQKVARLAVNHTRQRRQRRATRADAGCPVCFGEVSHPITLSCGHRWCRACLVGYMHASVDNKTFPLKCLGDDAKCSHCIPLATAQQLLDPDEFDAIVRASFTAYVQARPDEFHYCPTPDCPQVYRKTKRNTVLQCPSCLIRICPHCDTEWHESGSCQDRDPQEDYLFEQWKGRHDVKDCPSCKVPIERMAGCNHMTCVSCKTHICWACLATFPTSQEVYDHMRAIHGGIGL